MKRIRSLLELMNAWSLDAMLITSEANITYLTGFTGDSSRLIISCNGCAFITDGRYTEQASKECFSEIEIVKWIDDKRYGNETYEYVFQKYHLIRIGFEGNIVSFDAANEMKTVIKQKDFLSINGLPEQLRMIKEEKEIEHLRKACNISDKALELTIPYIKRGVSEIEIAARLDYHLKTNGADDISFATIVLSGAKTSLLHGKPSDKKLENGDFILFDFGALYKGYHADISRTFILGKASEQQKEMYQIISDSLSNACRAIKPGVAGNIPDKIVRETIPEKYINNYYPGLGHGVGLQIHEEPFIKNSCSEIIQEHMTITIEPGIYIPDFGGLRIEDTILITKNGIETLTKFPTELMIL
jgi:Xaa-Pro aminopeptidase